MTLNNPKLFYSLHREQPWTVIASDRSLIYLLIWYGTRLIFEAIYSPHKIALWGFSSAGERGSGERISTQANIPAVANCY